MKPKYCFTAECYEHTDKVRTYRMSRAVVECEVCHEWFCLRCIDDHTNEDGDRCEPDQYDGQLIDTLVKTVDKVLP